MDVRKNQNLGFGTAFIKYDMAALRNLTPNNQKKVYKLLEKGIKLTKGSPPYCDCVYKNYYPDRKIVETSYTTGNTGIYYTSDSQKKEEKFARVLLKLFGYNGVETKIIPNKPKLMNNIADEIINLSRWVTLG